MTDSESATADSDRSDATDAAIAADASEPPTIQDIMDDLLLDIQLGHVEDDVADVLAERLADAGIDIRPEEIDTLADDIENHSSR